MDKEPARPAGKSGVIAQHPEMISDEHLIHFADESQQPDSIYQAFADNTKYVYWCVKPNLTDYLFVSDAYEQIFGRDPETLRDTPEDLFAGIHPSDQEPLLCGFENASNGIQQQFTIRVNPTEDYTRTLAVTLAPVYEGDEVTAVAGQGIDITKQANCACAHFADFLETSPNEVITLNSDLQVSFATSQAESLFNMSSEHATGTTTDFLSLIHQDDRRMVLEELRDIFDTHRDKTKIEARLPGPTAKTRWVNIYAYQYTSNGVTDEILLFTRDITHRKYHEEKLRAFQAAIESAAQPITWTDADGVIEYVNPAFEELTGYQAHEAVGRTHAELQTAQHDQSFYDEILTTVCNGEVWTGEVTNQTKSGDEYIVQKTVAPIKNNHGEVTTLVSVNTDITEKKTREKELSEKTALLETVTETGLEGIIVHGNNEEVYLTNDEFLQMWDIPQDVAEGDFDPDLIDIAATQVEKSEEFIERIQWEKEHPEQSSSDIIKLTDGRYFKRVSTPITGTGDESFGRVVGYQDITDTKQQERQYRTLVENLPGIVYRCEYSETWPMELVHGEVESITGYTEAELLGDVEWGPDVMHPGDRDSIAEQVDQMISEDGFFEVTYRVVTKAGEVKWMWERGQQIGDNRLEGFITDITDREVHKQELERQMDIFRKAEEVADIGAWEYYVNTEDVWWSDGVKEIHGLGEGYSPTPEEALDHFLGEHQKRIENKSENTIDSGQGYDITAPIIDADGNKRWLQTRGEPQYKNGEIVSLRGTVQDITEQKQHEQMLEELNEYMKQLFRTDTDTQIAHTVVDIVEEVIGKEIVSVLFYNEQHGVLRPTASSELFEELGEPLNSEKEKSTVWDAYTGHETVSARRHENSEEMQCTLGTEVQSEVAIPLGEYGVLIVGDFNPDPISTLTVDLLEILASTANEALDRADQTHELHKQNRQLEKKKERLDRARQLNTEIRAITRRITQAETSDEIDQALCDAITNISGYDYAWIGKPDQSAGELTVATTSGDPMFAEGLPRELTADNKLPAVRVEQTETQQVEQNIAADVQNQPWRTSALRDSYRSVVSVPLQSDGILYGVLTVYSQEMDRFDEITQEVLVDVGEFAGYAYSAVGRRGELMNTETTVLTFAVSEYDTVLSEIATETGEQLVIEHIAPTSQDSRLLYVSMPGRFDEEKMAARFLENQAITDVNCISNSERLLFELRDTSTSIKETIVGLGGQFRMAVVQEDTLLVTVNVPTATDTRQYSKRVKQAIDAPVSLRSKNPGEGAPAAYQVTLRENLSPTQEQVLQTAYHNGYFDKHRKRTGTDIAESLDIAQPTFSMRLRTAQRNLLQSLYEAHDDYTDT